MVDDTISDNTTTNKGVNVESPQSPAGVHRYAGRSSTSSSTNPPSKSLTDIKNEIQTVLDLMGPSTPPTTTPQHTSSEADNEDSLSSVPSKSNQLQSPASSRKRVSSKGSVSLASDRNDSVLADAGTLSPLTNTFDNFDVVQCPYYDHMEQHILPRCLCMVNYPNHNVPQPRSSCQDASSTPNKCTSRTSNVCKKNRLLQLLRNTPFDVVLKKSASGNPCQLYKIDISGQNDDGCLPKRVVFDLVGGIPKPCSSTVATNTIKGPVERIHKCNKKCNPLKCDCKSIKNQRNVTVAQDRLCDKNQKVTFCDSDANTRVDYYFFDHGNAQYFHTTDPAPVMVCEVIAEKTEKYTTKFWAEFFASIHIAVSFCVSFILQLFKFILYSILRPLTVGLMQLASDYFFKPFLTILFNGLIQPCLIFCYNVATSVRDLCDPIAEGIGYFLRELAVLFRAMRLCTYKKNTGDDNCECNRKRNCIPSYKKQKCEC